MPRLLGPRSKAAAAAPSGPPALYEEALTGPPLVVEITGLSLWTTKNTADATRRSGYGGLTSGARWGHTAVLSPNESLLYIVGGTPCKELCTSEEAVVPLWEYTTATTASVSTGTNTSYYKMAAAAVFPASHVWMPGAVHPAARHDTIHSAHTDNTEIHDWPLFSPWWALWPSVNGTDGPSAVCTDGGWNGVRRMAGVRVFSEGAGEDHNRLLPPQSAVVASNTRSHHSVTNIQGRLYRFGGETQQGTAAALEEIEGVQLLCGEKREADDLAKHDHEREAAAPMAAVPRGGLTGLGSITAAPRPFAALDPPPPRAAHGACSLNQRYIVVFGGRQVHTQADDDTGATGGQAGKGARAKKTATTRSQSPAKRGGSPGRDTKGPPAAVDPTVPRSATLTALKDVAIYDTTLGTWLPVRVGKCGAAPCARYAAAVAAVPAPVVTAPAGRHRSPSGESLQREVLVVGGLDAKGAVCTDAWVMQVLSGIDAELAEVPTGGPSTAVPLVRIRWVRLELRCAGASLFQRHHAAAVVSSQRVAYLVGGCGTDGAAVPCVCTLELPPLTASSVKLADEVG